MMAYANGGELAPMRGIGFGAGICGVHEANMCLFADGVNGYETEQRLLRGRRRERISVRRSLVAR